MVKKIAPFVLVLFFNLWIWKIFSFSFIVGIVVLASTIFLWLSVSLKKGVYFGISIVLFILLLSLDWKTSSKNSLTFLNDNEKILLEERLRAYPPVGIKIGSKMLYIPAGNWLEQRKETRSFYKLGANLSEIIDPNLYFFANHPRERVGAVEYEKFPFILMPFFILGLLSINKKNAKVFLLSTTPFVLNSIIGNSNPMGPFALFPLIVVTTSLGLSPVFEKKIFYIPGLFLFFLIFIQTIAYATY